MAEGVLRIVRDLLLDFADSTGLTPGRKPRRYLWNDAFAVCGFLELYTRTGDEEYKRLVLRLVDQVHHVLGRHREDDVRTGWISGLDELEGEKHPTIGGLRIGKELRERAPDEPFNELLERERDGQYYHYLTKWMRALNKVSRVTGDPTYNLWAVELAKTAHASFTCTPPSGGRKRMYWKMSIDLTRPLVPFMGQHDPLDGLITYMELQVLAPRDPRWPSLEGEIVDAEGICEGMDWVTDDPLSIGGLLCDAYRLAQLTSIGRYKRLDLLETVLDSSLRGLEAYAAVWPLDLPPVGRPAFREIGLSIGLHAAEKLRELVEEKPGPFREARVLRHLIEEHLRCAPVGRRIERLWLRYMSMGLESWEKYRDINLVMLATSLAPDEYLRLP